MSDGAHDLQIHGCKVPIPVDHWHRRMDFLEIYLVPEKSQVSDEWHVHDDRGESGRRSLTARRWFPGLGVVLPGPSRSFPRGSCCHCPCR
jgi:hypothetical protein